MARIRSIHPGIWTDEGFMALSCHSRLLFIGLWNEAFDDGVFEWKPLTIKARIFPVDNVNVADLLDELISVGFIKKTESTGKPIGLIRNFQRFQRPKKPNSSGMLPDEWRTYVAFAGGGSEPVTDQSSTSGEKSDLMEDGGWRVEDEKGNGSRGERAGARERPPRKHPLEFDWAPSPETVDRCNALGLTAEEVAGQCVVFVTWHRSRGEERADWQEAFFLWCKREADKLGRKPGKPAIPRETVYVRQLDDAWEIYAEAWKAKRGRSPPTDRDGGWHFPADLLETTTSH